MQKCFTVSETAADSMG